MTTEKNLRPFMRLLLGDIRVTKAFKLYIKFCLDGHEPGIP